MRQMEYIGMIESDGHLSLPNTVRDQMQLKPDQVVRVTILMDEPEEEETDSAIKCFRSMGKNAEPGRLAEASVRHDEYLYGNRK